MSKQRTLSLNDLPALMDLRAAANAVEMHPMTLRQAIRKGELEAFIPRGRVPLRAGPGQGYRITRESLTKWYFGQ